MNAQSADSTLASLQPQPVVMVVSGPSGVGKDAVLTLLRERRPETRAVVTATTRPQREGERDGVDYIFLNDRSFDAMLAEDGFMEWAVVYGNRYGVPRDQVRAALADGADVVIKTDVQGAATIRGLYPVSVLVFIAPPSMAELERRLQARSSEPAGDFERRLATAREEIARMDEFDYVVVNENDGVADAADAISAILQAERWRYPRRRAAL